MLIVIESLFLIRSIMVVITSLFKSELAYKTPKSARDVPSGREYYYEDKSNLAPEEILRSIYTMEHTRCCRAQDKKLVHKCRHCVACKGIPASAYGNNGTSLKDKVLDMVTQSSGAARKYHQGSSGYRSPFYEEVPIKVRKGPVPTSRWRIETSLGSEKSELLEKRLKGQVKPLNLPERYTNIASLRIAAPSDMCMEKYSFAGIRAAKAGKLSGEKLHILEAKELACKHGRYLETVHSVSAADLPKSKSTKASPQSVLVNIHSSGTSSNSSSGHFEPCPSLAPAAAHSEVKASKKKKKKKLGFDFIGSFLTKCATM